MGEHEPLHFEMNRIDYGVFDCRGRGEMISFEFPFAVNDDRDIVIQKVEASCGCTIPDENILNKKLSPSSKHSLVLTMDVHGRAGFFTTDALAFTDVAPFSPVLLRMSVFVVREMDINPLPVKFQGKYDKPIEPESIFINHLRDVSVPGYVLDAENCDFGIFTLVDLQSSSEKKRGMSNAVLDHICLILATTERFPIGVHEKKIRLAWKEGDRQPITEIPIQIQIMHPFQLAVDHVYLGNLKAMETGDISVKVLSLDMTNVPKPTIES